MKRGEEKEKNEREERENFLKFFCSFFLKFFSSFFLYVTPLETISSYTSSQHQRSTTQTTLLRLRDSLCIKIFSLDTLLKRKNTEEETLRFLTNKNVEQTYIEPRGRRVGKKRLPSRVRRLSRPEPVRENAERKLRRGVRHLGKTVHGVPMATRTRREV